MRILVVSDLHGNWPALAQIDEDYDLCVCLGDLVEYGPEPTQCIDWVRRHAHFTVRGNHDHGLAQGVSVQGQSGYRYLTQVTRSCLSDLVSQADRSYLGRLPLQERFTVDGIRYLMVHATPKDPLDGYALPEVEVWQPLCESVEADIVLVGHTHFASCLDLGHVQVINPGSVGLPRDGDPRLSYAIIEEGRVTFRRVPYPIEETIAQIARTNLPEEAKMLLANNLRTGTLAGLNVTMNARDSAEVSSQSGRISPGFATSIERP